MTTRPRLAGRRLRNFIRPNVIVTSVPPVLKGDILQLDLRANWHFPRDPLFGQFPTFYAPSSKGNWVLLSGGEYDSHLRLGSRAISAI